jgi:hypothetical protein
VDWLLAISKAVLMLPIVFELPPVSLGGGILMRLPVKYPELVIFFKEASRNFRSIFQDIEDAKNLKTSAPIQKVLIWFLRPSKKINHLVTLSL